MADPTRHHETRPPGHVPLPVLLTGGMGLALAGGIHFLGLLEPLDAALLSLVSPEDEQPPAAVSPAFLWIATAAITFGLAFVMLEVPGTWRRAVIWASTMVVVAAWLPVAAIAQQHAPVTAPLIAGAWAGLCSIIYAARHHMDADGDTAEHAPSGDPPEATRTPDDDAND